MEVINIAEKFGKFTEHWSPKIIGELNGQHIKLAKIKGEFTWHSHENEDECFFVIKGEMIMKFRDHEKVVKEGEFIIVPRGIEHLPMADEETHLMLFEPNTTVNTGEDRNEFTKINLDKI
jgi:mannose-6-phosphate isomerase-like protein (cupin superfamily)